MAETESYNMSPGSRRIKRKSTKLNSKPVSPRPEPTMIKRRNSSFANSSSPWFRRNSFLSPSMIQNENFSVYEAPSYYSDTSSYNIISLKECQGFIFNQDLFATPYQQSRSLAIERKYRASFSANKNRSGSHSSKSITPERQQRGGCDDDEVPQSQSMQRRHTSYHPRRPSFVSSTGILDSSAIDDSMEDDEDYMNDVNMDTREEPSRIDEDNEDSIIANEYDEYDDDEDEEDDYQEMRGYHGDVTNRRYRVKVTEIVINEKDSDIFPH
ncbi:uncharacterized protein J8A68_002671 [[Candida] subhashii]|uniref:Uncharacterized protein n=1 Tax=[Candida] subhashii TaxID=561895 RepID=A0A8J5UNJ0_9ASCO|nr:uncharacterized protein J8A68_002671 [[Candida] subhashii]KAG7663811.1 hypothetical protein J8A68_002671 [[Candida] subhashii]